MRNGHVFLVEPDNLCLRDLDQVQAIYEASFSPSLKVPFSELIGAIKERRHGLYLATTDHVICGFAHILPLGIPGVTYLSYLAVDSSQRQRGVGSVLFQYVLRDAYQRTGATEMLWEVERPRPSTGPDDPDRRRIAFYERNGGVLLDLVGDYRTPDFAGPGTLQEQLMWISVLDRGPLTHSELEAYVVALYRTSYDLGPDAPLVQAALRSILS